MNIQTTKSESLSTLEEARPFRRAMRNLEREIGRALASQTDCCGVSSAQCYLLLEIAELGEGSISDFAQRLELDISTLSRGVESLVKAGLAVRVTDASNRRRQIVGLSEEGHAKAKLINQTCDSYYLKLLEALPQEFRSAACSAVPLLSSAMKQARIQAGDCGCTCPSGESHL